MKGFIEVTAIDYGSHYKDDVEEINVIENIALLNINDIARFQYGRLILKTPYQNGSNCIQTKETYEEIKELVKQATEL